MAHVYTTTSPWQLAATSSNNDKDRPCYHYDDDDDDEEGGAHARHALGAADGVTSAVRLSRHIPQREQMNMAVAAYNLLECHDKPRRHVDDGGRCYSGMDDDSCHGGSDSSHHRYISAGDDKVVVVVGNCYGILPFSPDTTTSPLPLSSSSSSSSRSSVTEYAAVSATTTGSDGGDDCNEDSNNSSSSRSNAAPAVARMMTTSAHTSPSLLATSASSLSASTYTSLSESFMSDDSSYVTSVYNDMLAEQLAGPRDRNSNNSYSRSSHTMRGCCGSAAVVTAPTVSNARCLWHTGLAHSNHDMHATNNGDNNEAKGEDDNDNDDDDDDDVARVRAIAAQCTHRLGGSGSVLDLHPRMGNVYGSGHSSTTAVAGGDAYCRGVCRRTAQDHVNAHTSASMLPLSGQRRATPPPQQQQRSRQAAHAAPLPWPSSRATRPAFVTRRYASMRTAAVTTTTATMATAVGSSSSSSSNGGGSGVARAAARARWLPSNPECVLDAPELPCDAGQQVLDWARCHDTLAIGLGHTVYTWQPQTRQSCKLVELDASTRVRGVRWLHHDACVAISAVDEAVVVVHDARRQGLLRRVRLGSECGAAANGATAVVTAMAVHGPLLAVASDGVGGAIDVFDLRAREARVCTHYTHRGAVASLAYCAAEPFYLASGGRDDDDGGVCVWDVRRPTEPRYRLDHLHRGSVSALLWHPTRRSRLLTGGGVDGVLCYINTHAPLRTLDARVSGDGGGCGVGVGGGDDGYADEVNTGYVVAQEDGGDDGDVAMSRDDHHADSSVTATRTPLPLSYAARHATWRARRGDGGTSDTAVHMLTRAVNTLHPITGIACCDGDRDSAAVSSRPHAYGRDEGDDEGGRSGSSGVLRGAAGGGGAAAALPRKTGDIVVTSHKSTGQLQLRRVCDFRLHGVLRTHASEADMTCLSMSADQQRVCVAQSDETLTFWRVATAASGPTSRTTTAACSAGARGCYSRGGGSTATSQTACGVAHYNDVTHMLLDDEQAPQLR